MLIVIVRNSTEQLQRYARDLERRNHELDQFAYIASHDLKAPLRAIVNLATWIDEDAKDVISSEAKQHLVLLRTRVRRLEALIDGIHRYATATRPAPHPAPIDVAAMVRDIAEEHDASRRFVLDLPADLPVVVADRTRLWQVFSNLIANAIKHHHLGGGTIHVGWRDISDHHEFSVSDDGPGIPDRYHDKVFEIFQTLQSKDDKNGKDGLGLGLALVKKIVREEGGTISLHSEAGQGATFCFTWPKQMADSLVEVE